jgi:hypothetical protein
VSQRNVPVPCNRLATASNLVEPGLRAVPHQLCDPELVLRGSGIAASRSLALRDTMITGLIAARRMNSFDRNDPASFVPVGQPRER